jgi:HK97 family phage major capsid protein
VEWNAAVQEEFRKILDEHNKRLRELEKSGKKGNIGVSLPGAEQHAEEFSFRKAVLAIAERNPALAPLEWDIMQETGKHSKRVMSSSDDTKGGYLIPQQVMPGIIEALDARLVLNQLGATIVDGLIGSPVTWNREDAGVTAYWVAEGAATTASDATSGQLNLKPHGVAALTKINNRTLRMSNPSIETWIRNSMVRKLALKMELGFLRGVGGENQPLGIVNTAGIGSVSSIGSITTDHLDELMYTLENANADMGSIGYLSNPKVKYFLATKKDGNGNPILHREKGEKFKETLLGYPFARTTQMPNNLGTGTDESQMLLGNWEDLVIGRWEGMEIRASSETSDAFEKNQTWFHAIMDVDSGLLHAASMVLGDGITS